MSDKTIFHDYEVEDDKFQVFYSNRLNDISKKKKKEVKKNIS